jgi:hypothetical protein
MTGWSLIAIGVLCGAVMMWVFRRTTDLAAARVAGKQMLAHFAEFRLFFDEPRLIWRAQKELIAANLRWLVLMLPPALILALPAVWLFAGLDAIYGRQPLPVGAPTVVSARMDNPFDTEDAPATLEAPAGIAVETPPVRSAADSRISWRVRPLGPMCGSLRFTLRGRTLDKTISAGCRTLFLSRGRSRSLLAFLLEPGESRLPAGEVDALEVDYPSADVKFAGMTLPWIVWFLLASAGGALLAS